MQKSISMFKVCYLSVFIVFANSLFGQDVDCDSLITDYEYYTKGADDAFCNGVYDAYNTIIPTLYYPINNTCQFQAYERWGVKLVEIDLDLNTQVERAYYSGFNSGSSARIKQEGTIPFDSLGIIRNNWAELEDHEIIKELTSSFIFEQDSLSNTIFRIDTVILASSIFIDLKGVKFTDKRTNLQISYNDLLQGIILDRNVNVTTLYLELDWTEYDNPGDVCIQKYIPYSIPIKI